MKYTGQFKSIQYNQSYTVDIFTNNDDSSTKEIILGPQPFKVEYNGSDQNIYTPIKSSSATIQIVSNPMYFDLYSSTAKQNRVELRNENSLKWVGYTTPNAYSTPFAHENETYEVEALDALGILQYFKYKEQNTAQPSEKTFVSFTHLINTIFSSVNDSSVYNNVISEWCIPSTVKISGYSHSVPITDLLYISEQNFYNEEGEAMKLSEVLSEVCKYLGLTAMCMNRIIYFIDYDAIENTKYYIYTVGNDQYTGTTTRGNLVEIRKEHYRSSGTTISLDNVYNKVKVKDSLYKVETIMPKMFENEDLINVEDYPDGDQN